MVSRSIEDRVAVLANANRLRNATYDDRCYDLALVFLSDDPTTGPERVDIGALLAAHIQEAIEGFLEFDLPIIKEGRVP